MTTAVVVVREPGRASLRLVVTSDVVEIGRDCAGLVLTDPQISRRHLSLALAAGGVVVSDLGSTNGTSVDGRPLSRPHVLAPNEVVTMGTTTIELVAEPDLDAVPREPGVRETSIDLVAAAAVSDPPDLRSLPADSGTLTIVFSDIEGSTDRAVSLGDERWMDLLAVHNAIVRRKVERHGGTEIKAQGDGFMLSFPSARRAILAMLDIQATLAAHGRSRPTDQLRVRVGIHTGEVMLADDGDLFGRHVVMAARVASAASGGETLVTSLVRELVESRREFAFGPPRDVSLKGLGRVPVHPIIRSG